MGGVPREMPTTQPTKPVVGMGGIGGDVSSIQPPPPTQISVGGPLPPGASATPPPPTEPLTRRPSDGRSDPGPQPPPSPQPPPPTQISIGGPLPPGASAANQGNATDTTNATVPPDPTGQDQNPPPDLGGDVIEWTPPENRWEDSMNQVYANIMEGLQGGQNSPQVQAAVDAVTQKQTKEQEELEQMLALRGLSNSTQADQARAELGARHRAEVTNTTSQAQASLMQTQLAPLAQLFNQFEGGRGARLNEFTSFWDRQFRGDQADRDAAFQALNLMAGAMGMNTYNPGMPNYQVPPSQPGVGAGLGNILGNVATAAVSNPNFDFTSIGL